VDDEPEILEILNFLLLTEGHSSILARNGREAVEIACLSRPDIVFLDVKMPVLDGFGALRELRGIVPETKVVMMTACPEVDFVTRAFKEGAVAFLGKPFDMAAVRRILHDVLYNKDKVNKRTLPQRDDAFV
ncbi:MAG: response regulator, partial [Ammonifex sp.]